MLPAKQLTACRRNPFQKRPADATDIRDHGLSLNGSERR